MQVHDLVMAAMLAAEPELHGAARMHVPHRTNCFEVTTAFCMSHRPYACPPQNQLL